MTFGKFVEAFNQHLIFLDTKRVVPLRTPGLPQHSASTPLAHAQLAEDVVHGLALLAGRQNFPFTAKRVYGRPVSELCQAGKNLLTQLSRVEHYPSWIL